MQICYICKECKQLFLNTLSAWWTGMNFFTIVKFLNPINPYSTRILTSTLAGRPNVITYLPWASRKPIVYIVNNLINPDKLSVQGSLQRVIERIVWVVWLAGLSRNTLHCYLPMNMRRTRSILHDCQCCCVYMEADINYFVSNES